MKKTGGPKAEAVSGARGQPVCGDVFTTNKGE
ncbi:hypothetical protein I656_00406 [Geobacillus sp. WSUCF1]|nr:hypothetical protein I656_00406 [Geobacillus sp. WSUCF1]